MQPVNLAHSKPTLTAGKGHGGIPSTEAVRSAVPARPCDPSPALGEPGMRVPREGSPSPSGAGAAPVPSHLPAGHRPGARMAPPGCSWQLQEAVGGAERAESRPTRAGDSRATSRQTT